MGARPDPDEWLAAWVENERRLGLEGFIAAIVAVATTTVLGKVAFGANQLADIVMLYLLAIVIVSLRWGLVPSLAAAVLSVFALDFFFIPPFHTFVVSDMSHVATFAVMFFVAVVISGLTKRVRDQAEAARGRELRTASLYSLSGALSRSKTTEDIALAGADHVHEVFGARAIVLIPHAESDADGRLGPVGTGTDTFVLDENELGIATQVWEDGRPRASAKGSFRALETSGARVGVLGLEGREPSAGDAQHLAAFARQIADALQRTRLAERAHEAQLRVETEQLRNSLLSSVSHDLRTPLAAITGAASTLLDRKITTPVREELTEAILTEAELLNRLVRNLLDMTRLEAGAVEVKKEWQAIEEAVGVALSRVERMIGKRTITTDLPADLPLVPYDPILLQQVLVNLLENAAKYTQNEIAISARVIEEGRPAASIEITVADRGPGLPKGDGSKIFAKFHRAERGRGGGVGLGLTICKGIVTAHGGRIWAENREGGGAAFRFTLPIEGSPPSMDAPETSRRAEALP